MWSVYFNVGLHVISIGTDEEYTHCERFINDGASISHFRGPRCTQLVVTTSGRCQHHLTSQPYRFKYTTVHKLR